MIAAKSMDVRDNFKSWCGQVADGEIVQIARPGNSYVYLIGQETYDKFTMKRRVEAYTSYLFGKDKITNIKRLSEIEKLSDNWNNNGAGKIPTSIIKAVRKLLMTIEFQPEIFPTACDALQLEWENDKDEYLEMEILEDAVNIFQIDSDGNEEQKIMKFDSETINKVVRSFMTEQFDIHERLYRAVYPPEIMPMFWKENGEISSAVLGYYFDNAG